MALLTYTDIQESLNIDLTSPNGQSLATDLIAAAVDYAETITGYPLEEVEVTEYFDQGQQRLWLDTRAPVSNLTIAQYNTITSAFDAFSSAYIRQQGSDVYVSVSLPAGFQSVRATYTTGWTAATLPRDLRDALIELVGLKLQERTNYSSNPDDPAGDGSGVPTGALKRVSAGGYSEEYTTSGQAEVLWKAKATQLARTIGEGVPAEIVRIFETYRRPFAV